MSKRVLVVDDDAAILETFARNLTRWGYEVSTAESAERALTRVREIDPAVIVTDVRMSGMDGLDLLRTLRERADDIDVIVMTAFEDMRTAIESMKAGAFEYLVKPLDLDHLELTLRRCFADRGLRRRARQLSADAGEPYALDRIAGRDTRMIEIYKMIGQLVRNRAPVLIRGETGTGKELIARAIHFNSSEAEEPFVAVNCTAIPEPLLESELFGHRRGAFTGALSDRRGRFSAAGHGTIFLDEIGDTNGAFQAKLLRVLQDHEYTPVGADRAESTEARVIAATHRDLEDGVRAGSFREDLYFRLRVVEIRVPPLRERRGDIPVLAEYFLDKISRQIHRPRVALTLRALARLTTHSWPGNVRELENTLTRACVLCRGGVVDVGDVALTNDAPAEALNKSPHGDSLREAERSHVQHVLEKADHNKRRAARMLAISRARLERLIAKHGLRGKRGSDSTPVLEQNGLEPSPERSAIGLRND